MTQQPAHAVRPGLAVREGRLGRGVFAIRAFAKGATVETCPTLEVSESDVSGLLGDYVFSSGSNPGDVVLLLGFGMLYNHSAAPNLEYVQDDETTISFVALRPIRKGEELTIDYGEEWWETRGLTPD